MISFLVSEEASGINGEAIRVALGSVYLMAAASAVSAITSRGSAEYAVLHIDKARIALRPTNPRRQICLAIDLNRDSRIGLRRTFPVAAH